MYKFNKKKNIQLLKGRKEERSSKQINYTSVTLYNIFNGHKTCKKVLALAIVKTLNNDYEIEDFFEIVEGE